MHLRSIHKHKMYIMFQSVIAAKAKRSARLTANRDYLCVERCLREACQHARSGKTSAHLAVLEPLANAVGVVEVGARQRRHVVARLKLHLTHGAPVQGISASALLNGLLQHGWSQHEDASV